MDTFELRSEAAPKGWLARPDGRPTLDWTASPITLRPGRPEDAEAAGRICYEAFANIANAHSFPRDFPTPEAAIALMQQLLAHPGIYAVVAEREGTLLGSNFLDCRDAVAAVGPISVDPKAQNSALGRRLMQAVLRYARERSMDCVRLVQSAYHSRSLSLYSKLGFAVREPLACMQGATLGTSLPGTAVRPAVSDDLADLNRLARALYRFDRGGELADAIAQGTAMVVEREGRITGYTTGIGFFGHALGEQNIDLQALLVAADSIAGPGFLLPMRNEELFRWALEFGFRVVQPLTLMSLGPYTDPSGPFLPSILY